MSWILYMAWRDSRRQRRRLVFYTAAIAIGIAALVSLRSLATSLEEEVDLQASALLGADMEIESNRPFSEDLQSAIDSLGGQRADQVVTSMIFLPRGTARLTDSCAGRPLSLLRPAAADLHSAIASAKVLGPRRR